VDLPEVVIYRGREKKLRSFYPWVQKGEVKSMPEGLEGCLVRVVDHQREFIGIGTATNRSRFPVRVWSLKDEPLDQAFFQERIRAALDHRNLHLRDTNARRILFAEADRLPGLIVDDYDGHFVVQVRQKGAEMLREQWLPALIAEGKPKSVYEKSDMLGREEEGLEPTVGALYGSPPSEVPIQESGLDLLVPTHEGLKTGYYLDQRQTRRRLGELVKPGDKVIDTFCYSGAFSLYATRAGADCLGIDIHPVAIQTAEENARRNRLKPTFIQANAFEWLEHEAKIHAPFDWVILDPPAIAKKRGEKNSLKWAIWKLAYFTLPHLKPGGTVIVCTCSYQLSIQETLETVRLAAADQGISLSLDAITLQDVDHPAPIAFPEALYLKCLWLRRLS
jgi:23S rRNA (cytosine1962-C5)-methyltransferase